MKFIQMLTAIYSEYIKHIKQQKIIKGDITYHQIA